MPSRSPNDTEDYNGLKRRVQLAIVLVARAAKLRPPSRFPVAFSFIWHEPDRRRDTDNIRAGGTKLLLDAFVEAGVLPGDDHRYVAAYAGDLYVYQGARSFRGPGVHVAIGPVSTDDGFSWVIERELWVPFRLPDWNEMSAAREYGARKSVYRRERAAGTKDLMPAIRRAHGPPDWSAMAAAIPRRGPSR